MHGWTAIFLKAYQYNVEGAVSWLEDWSSCCSFIRKHTHRHKIVLNILQFTQLYCLCSWFVYNYLPNILFQILHWSQTNDNQAAIWINIKAQYLHWYQFTASLLMFSYCVYWAHSVNLLPQIKVRHTGTTSFQWVPAVNSSLCFLTFFSHQNTITCFSSPFLLFSFAGSSSVLIKDVSMMMS